MNAVADARIRAVNVADGITATDDHLAVVTRGVSELEVPPHVGVGDRQRPADRVGPAEDRTPFKAVEPQGIVGRLGGRRIHRAPIPRCCH